jgi:hypothetical protein
VIYNGDNTVSLNNYDDNGKKRFKLTATNDNGVLEGKLNQPSAVQSNVGNEFIESPAVQSEEVIKCNDPSDVQSEEAIKCNDHSDVQSEEVIGCNDHSDVQSNAGNESVMSLLLQIGVLILTQLKSSRRFFPREPIEIDLKDLNTDLQSIKDYYFEVKKYNSHKLKKGILNSIKKCIAIIYLGHALHISRCNWKRYRKGSYKEWTNYITSKCRVLSESTVNEYIKKAEIYIKYPNLILLDITPTKIVNEFTKKAERQLNRNETIIIRNEEGFGERVNMNILKYLRQHDNVIIKSNHQSIFTNPDSRKREADSMGCAQTKRRCE